MLIVYAGGTKCTSEMATPTDPRLN